MSRLRTQEHDPVGASVDTSVLGASAIGAPAVGASAWLGGPALIDDPPPGAGALAEVGSRRGPMAWLQQRARESGGAIALRHKARGLWRRWSWAEIDREVVRLTRGWRSLGLAPGERVLVFAASRPRVLFTVLAVQAAGGVALLVDSAIDADVLAALLHLAPARYVFAPGEDEVDAVEQAAAAANWPVERIVYDDPRGLAARGEPHLLDYAEVGNEVGQGKPDNDSELPTVIDVAGVEVIGSPAAGPPTVNWIAPVALIAAGQRAGVLSPLRADDEALLVEPLATEGALTFVLGRWLAEGFRLSLGEAAESLDTDRRDLEPSYLAASPAFYEQLWARTRARLGGPRSWRRRIVHGAIGARVMASRAGIPSGPRASWRRALARLLVLRPLARALGLARVRQLVVVGGTLPAAVQAFFQALELSPISVALPPATPVVFDIPSRGAYGA